MKIAYNEMLATHISGITIMKKNAHEKIPGVAGTFTGKGSSTKELELLSLRVKTKKLFFQCLFIPLLENREATLPFQSNPVLISRAIFPSEQAQSSFFALIRKYQQTDCNPSAEDASIDPLSEIDMSYSYTGKDRYDEIVVNKKRSIFGDTITTRKIVTREVQLHLEIFHSEGTSSYDIVLKSASFDERANKLISNWQLAHAKDAQEERSCCVIT